MEQVQHKSALIDWLGPVFLVTVVVVFLILPFPLMDKLHGVCFGI